MLRVFLPLLTLALTYSCSGPELRGVEEQDGSRTEYHVDPETEKKEGTLRHFDPRGRLSLEETYAAGQLTGPRRLYHPDGKLAVEETYADGRITGEYRSYNENGTLRQFGRYVDGAMNDTWLRYYEDGKIMEEVTFVDNQENGPFREWYPDGKPKASGNYLDGDKEHGLLHLYLESGELERVMKCDRGACNTFWSPDSMGTAPEVPDMQPPTS